MTETDASALTVSLPVRSRFAQLTYTSFHREGGSGGWQVKDVRGDLDISEERALTARISTRLAPATRLPTLPTAEERAALPRRLVYAETVEGAHAFWHTIPAGTDSSGRPGNVFAHVVLDRRPLDVEPALRTSDLIGAPQWLRPYGSNEVLASALDDVPDLPWGEGPMSAESVVPFLVDTAVSKPAVLAAVLDAVADALDDGPPVVLGVEEPGHAELWIAGVLHLMSPATGRRMFWSTAEKAEALSGPLSIHLAVVPRHSVDDLDPAEMVLLTDDHDAVELGDLVEGQPHRTRRGSKVPVGPWSVLAQEVLQDVDLALRTLASADRVAATVGDRSLSCAWPLAMAVSLAPRDFPDAQEEARQVLGAATPAGLSQAPELAREHRSALLGPLGPTTADAWAAADGKVPDVDRVLAVSVYLERALDDDAWLTRPEGVPLPEIPLSPDDQVSRRAADALRRVATGPAPSDSDSDSDGGLGRGVRLLRLVDLVVRARILDLSAAGPVPGLLDDALDDVVGPQLVRSDDGVRLAEAVGPIADAVADELLTPWLGRWLASAPGEPGSRLSPAVLMWVYPTPPAPPPVEALGTRAVSPLMVEVAAQVTGVVPDPSAFRALALDGAVRHLVEEGDTSYVSHLARGPAFATAELAAMARTYGVEPLAVVLPPTLRGAHDSEELDRLVDQVRDTIRKEATGPRRTARRLAELRFHAAGGSYGEWVGDHRSSLAELLHTAGDLVVDQPESPPPSVVRVLLVALLVDLVEVLVHRVHTRDDDERTRVSSWLEQHRTSLRGQEERMRADIEHVVERGVVTEVDFGAASLSATVLASDRDRSAARTWTSLVAVGRRPSIVDDALVNLLGRRDPEATEKFLNDVLHTVDTVVADPHRVTRDLDRMARERWRLPGSPSRLRRPWGKS